MRTLIAILTALMLFAATPVAAGDLEDAAAAYKARDYQKALRLWKSLAEQGNATAQSNLGNQYSITLRQAQFAKRGKIHLNI